MADKGKIRDYINDQIAQAEFRARAYVFDANNKKRPNRNVFVRLESHLDAFLRGEKARRWVVLTGLRGAGKTTIMHQLYRAKRNSNAYVLVLAVDEIVHLLGSSIAEVLSVFEEIVGRPFGNLDKPLLLFLDEVQNDEKWGVAIKTLYDKAQDVFVFATGSAALLMNTNADIARRALYEKIYPLSFSEFLKIRHGKFETKGLGHALRDCIFSAATAREVAGGLLPLAASAETYYHGVDRFNFENYLFYGSLPFMIALENEALVYDQISKSLERVVNRDIPQLRSLSSEIIAMIPAMLYAVADMDAINFSTLSQRFGISRPKVTEIFSVLEQTEVLHRIYPLGSHFTQVTQKPSKYLFSSPAFRAMYYKTIGNAISAQNARGKLLEDLVGMYLYRQFDKKPTFSLTYDSAKGGADFIVSTGERRIVVEVGINKDDYKQVAQTSAKVKAAYSIIISERATEVQYNEEANAVRIPLKYFILL